jgi:glycosyltransferase involved in cell wall biosynthesis
MLCHINLASGGSPIRKFPFVLVARCFGIPIVLQIHSGKFDVVFDSPNTPKLWKQIVSIEAKWASAIVGLNRNQILKLEESKLLKGKLTYFIPNAVKVSSFKPKLNFDSQKDFDLVFVGRFSEPKGAIELIEALKSIKHSSISLAVIGSIDINQTTEQISRALENHKVTFFGQIPNTQVGGILGKGRVLILPSHFENFPMVILEAFSLGVPVIASDVGEVQMLVLHNKTGQTVPPKNIPQLAKAIEYMLDANTNLSAMGSAAFAHVEQNFDISLYCSKLLNVYLEVQPNLSR